MIKKIQNIKTIIYSDEFPLLNILGCDLDLESYHFDNIQLKEIINNIGSYKRFKELNYKTIALLRFYNSNNVTDEFIESWCNKILRYIEINYSKLRLNERKYNRNKTETIKLFNQIFALFIEYYLKTHDLLYFNTALKIGDLKWIKPSKLNSKYKATYILFQIKKCQVNYILNEIENE